MIRHTYSEPPGGDQSQGWALLSVCWAFVLCAALTTISRVWVRARLTRNMGADDWTILATLFTTFIGAGLITAGVIRGGLGRHAYYLTEQQRIDFTALGWADWVQTFITLALMKISICLFLLRIVDATSFTYLLYGLIAFLSVFTIVFVCLMLAICTPLRAWWEIDVPGARCFSLIQFRNMVIVQGALSVFTDLILATFPIFFLRELQISFSSKAALCFLMGLGVITAACATVRTTLTSALTSPDESWAISSNVGWRLPEVNIGIVCANAPALRPLYLFLRGRLDTTRLRSKTGHSAAVSEITGSVSAASKSRGWRKGSNGSKGDPRKQSGMMAAGLAPKTKASPGFLQEGEKNRSASDSDTSGKENLVGAYAEFEGLENRDRDEEMGLRGQKSSNSGMMGRAL